MSPRCLARHLLVVAALAAGAARAGAQSMPAMTTAKNAARHAAAATNEHIRREQDVDAATRSPRATRAPAHATRIASAAARPTRPESAPAPGGAVTRATPAAAAARPATPGPTHAAPGGKPAGSVATEVSERTGTNEIALMRETFTYHVDGRRDPFVSLITSGELRPMISDLRLVTVVYDPAGGSVAVLRDVSTKEQYRVKSGQTLGRMRVARILPQSVVFTIEEFGFSRQESLALNDTTRARSQ